MSTSEIKKTKRSCKIISQECIGKDIYSMWLNAGEIAKNAVPGQFVSLYSRDGSKLLPRPISLCEIDKEEEKLRLVYRVTGRGTGTRRIFRTSCRGTDRDTWASWKRISAGCSQRKKSISHGRRNRNPANA